MNLSKELREAKRAALAGGKILKKYYAKDFKVMKKGEIDLVTVADIESEKKIVSMLRKSFPGYGFLAEEQTDTEGDGEFLWLIDPLDGTTNFAHSYPFFSVSIALAHKGDSVLGVVYDPITNELFHAVRGGGAFLNGKKIRVSRTAKLINSLICTGFPVSRRYVMEQNIKNLRSMWRKVQAIRRDGSAALDLCYLACGRFDAFFEYLLKPWDIAAGKLVVEEAGGKVTNSRGNKINVFSEEIIASNKRVHSSLLGLLKK